MKQRDDAVLTHRASRMQANNITTPQEALGIFFSCFTLEDGRNHLWELYRRCVLSYARERTPQDNAADILLFYTHTEMLLEAAWLLHTGRQRQAKKKS